MNKKKLEKDLELQVRWNKIRIANLYDALDKMGYPNQCLDLGIKPLFLKQHLAGKAVTLRGVRGDVRDNTDNTEVDTSVANCVSLVSVVVIDSGGEPWTGKFGEMTSWNIKQKGAKGIVIDGFIRDYLGLEEIPNYTVCARGTSPIESNKRWHIQDINIPIALPGTLSSQVSISPGDWIVGGPDGVIVVPQEIAMEALIKVEEIEEAEENMRKDMQKGISFKEAYSKWGRA